MDEKAFLETIKTSARQEVESECRMEGKINVAELVVLQLHSLLGNDDRVNVKKAHKALVLAYEALKEARKNPGHKE